MPLELFLSPSLKLLHILLVETIKGEKRMITLKSFITEIELVTKINLVFSQKPALKSFALDNPFRVVFDFSKVQGISPKEIPVNKYKIREIRFAQYQPEVMRLVVEGEEVLFYEVKSSQNTVSIEVWANLLKGRKIVLDAGHGGKDPGALGAFGLKEKDVTLKLVLAGKVLIEKLGGEVVLTRDKDVFIPLPQRVKIANSSNAQAFISVHLNAADDSTANGIETYYKDHREDSQKLAQALQQSLIREFDLKDRGVKTATFYVIKNIRLPAVLTEVGFITNPQEIKLIESPAGAARFARVLAKTLL